MTTENITKVREAMAEAQRMANIAGFDNEDGGTCNFDSPIVYGKIKLKELEAALGSLGLRCYQENRFNRKVFLIMGCTHGQGNMRTRMAEAFYKSLAESETMKELGIFADMWYEMD